MPTSIAVVIVQVRQVNNEVRTLVTCSQHTVECKYNLDDSLSPAPWLF